MRKKMALLLALMTMLYLCACSNTGDSDSQNGAKQVAVNATEVNNSKIDDIRNQLLGTWKNEYWGRVVSFVDEEKCILIEGTGNEFEMMNANYELIDSDTMILSALGEESVTMKITLSEGKLDFEEEGYEGFFSNDMLTKVNDGGKCEYSVVGSWELLGVDEEVSVIFNSKVTPINDLVFYYDGTYTMESNYPCDGNYKVVHDGGSICLDERYYWDVEFPCVGVMLLTTEGGSTWLYVSR